LIALCVVGVILIVFFSPGAITKRQRNRR